MKILDNSFYDKEHSYLKSAVIWDLLRQHKGYVFLLLLISMLIGVAGALNIALVYTILNWGLGVEPAGSGIFSRFIEFAASSIAVDDKFIAICIFFLMVSVSFCSLMYLEVVVRASLVVRVTLTAKMAIFKKFINADYQYFLDNKQGDLIYRATQAPDMLASLFFSMATIISSIILSIGLLGALFTITPKLTLFLIVLGVGYWFFTQHIGYKRLYFFGKQSTGAGQQHNILLNESITGMRSIKTSASENNWINKAKEILKKRSYFYKKTRLWESFPNILLRTLFYVCMGITIIIIRLKFADNIVAVLPVFGTLAFAVLNLIPKLSSLGLYKMRMLNVLPQAELVYRTLKEQNRNIVDGNKEFGELRNSIKLENIHFTYKKRPPLFKGISISFEKGKMTAIVGKSGSGKSTIAYLLLRLFVPEQGRIRIDGEDLKEYKASFWLSKIGFVDQDVFIYNGTIRENITFGMEGCSQDDIEDAARVANIQECISHMPQGYDTIVGDRGVRLSGGEKQRVAIARAVLRKPQIMIFDEATASLDSLSESLVQEAINNLLQDHTVIVIAHRLSTVQNADKIILIDGGKVVEEGTHQELCDKKGFYWKLYDKQRARTRTKRLIATGADSSEDISERGNL